MKYITTTIFLLLIAGACTQTQNQNSVKSEYYSGIIETNDPKSMALDEFHYAYLAKDMSGQLDIFAEGAVARINGIEVTPEQMIAGFLNEANYYRDITQTNRATSTFIYDNGNVYTNSWYMWTGVSISTGKVVDSPVHAYFRWEGDKVIAAGFVYDSHDYVMNMPSAK